MYAALHPSFQRLGSFANLGIVSIPEGATGFRIVQEWVRSVCGDLGHNPSGPMDRQWFMVACTLAFDLDRENARNYVPHSSVYRSTLWPQSLSRNGVDFSAQDSVAFVTAKAYDLFTFGSSYLRCVRDM